MMKRLSGALLAALLTTAPASAQGLLLRGVGGPVVTSGFVGAADVVASPTHWYGLRAMNATQATATFHAIRIIRASDSVLCDVNLATTGDLGLTASCSNAGASNGLSPTAFCNATTCKIDTIYDQASGSPVNMVQATDAKRPAFTLNCLNTTLPCATFAGAQVMAATITAMSQPFSFSTVVNRTSTTTQNEIYGGANAIYFRNNVTTSIASFFAAEQQLAAANATWHAFQSTANGASSFLNLDGSASGTSTQGAGQLAAATFLGGSSSTPANPLTGSLTEIGVWPIAFTGGQQTSVCTNQKAYWGITATC